MPQELPDKTSLTGTIRSLSFGLSLAGGLVISSLSLSAQEPPAAVPAEAVEEELQPDPERDRFEYAMKFYEAGAKAKDQYSKENYLNSAIPALESYIDSFPDSQFQAEAKFNLGMCYLLTRRLDDATRMFKLTIDKHQKGHYVGAAAYKIASIEYNNQKYDSAIPYFEKASSQIEQAPIRHNALYFEARCLIANESNQRAMRVLQKLVDDKDKPNTQLEKALQLIGHLHLKNKDYAEALAAFEKLLDPKVEHLYRGDALLNACVAATKLQQFDKADLYTSQLLSDPKLKQFHPEAQLALMTRAYEKGDYEGVLKSMAASNAAPKEPQLLAQRYMLAGMSCTKLNRNADAISYFNEAERALPQSKTAFEASYRRLLCFYNVEGVNIPDQVDAFMEIYADQYPESKYLHTALLMKAETLFARKEFKSAARAYNRIKLKNVSAENRAGFLYQKGWCLSESGDLNNAIQSLTTFLTDYPTDKNRVQALLMRGEAYLKTEANEDAFKDFQDVIKQSPKTQNAAIAVQRCGEIKRKENDFAATISHYQILLTEYPTLSQETKAHANFWTGWGYFKSDDHKNAIVHLTKARELSPNSLGKSAGIRLLQSYYYTEELDKLLTETREMIAKYPEQEIDTRILSWIGVKSYERADYNNAHFFLTLASTPDDPKQTKRSIWKFLGKTNLRLGKFEEALPAIRNTIDGEENLTAKADSLLDKARVLGQLGRLKLAKKAVEEGFALQKQGRIFAGLRMIDADIAYTEGRFADAKAHYVVVAELFVDDQELTPEALYKTANTLRSLNDPNAATYEELLKKNFPTYTKPEHWPLPNKLVELKNKDLFKKHKIDDEVKEEDKKKEDTEKDKADKDDNKENSDADADDEEQEKPRRRNRRN